MKYIVVPDDFVGYLPRLQSDGSIALEAVTLVSTVPTKGDTGNQGEPGAIGPRGFPGTAPIQLEGHGPPSDTAPITPGVDGQLYLDVDTGNLYERINGLWL